jgi:hypothetical protein
MVSVYRIILTKSISQAYKREEEAYSIVSFLREVIF